MSKRKKKNPQKRGRKPKVKTAEEIEKASRPKSNRGRRRMGRGEPELVKSLDLPEAARILVYKKEGRLPPPKIIAPCKQTSPWQKTQIEVTVRPPTIMLKKIPRVPSHEVIDGAGWLGLPTGGHTRSGD